MNQLVAFALSALAPIKTLREIFLFQNIANYVPNIQDSDKSFTIPQEFFSFFDNKEKLTVFCLLAKQQAEILSILPFDKLTQLEQIWILPGRSKLTDSDFTQIIDRLGKCLKLKAMIINLQYCPALTDLSIKHFADSFINCFQSLTTLNLSLKSGDHEQCQFTTDSWHEIMRMLENTNNLKNLTLHFANNELSKIDIKNLCHIPTLSSLKALDISFGSPEIDDSLAFWLTIAHLESLIEFSISLRSCDSLTWRFLKNFLDAWSSFPPENLRNLKLKLSDNISRSYMSDFASKMRKVLPNCSISISY